MVKEALACNCPVVGVDVGDVRQRLEGVNRCVVAEKDPLKLAVALKQVVGSGRSADGRKKLLSDGLSEEETAKKILRIYEQIRAGR
jgi:glycosyltransferase involved in cell wall biosynthesis